jgi:CrcB protein
MGALAVKHMATILLIGLGGFIGANARYWLGVAIAAQIGSKFPYATLIINVVGSLVLALFVGYLGQHAHLDPRYRLFFAVGFCGAFTTFSTFATESIALLQTEQWLNAVLYIVLTNTVCLMAVVVGLLLGGKIGQAA